MSDVSELYEHYCEKYPEELMESWDNQTLAKDERGVFTWTTKDGRVLPLDKMELDHLEATVALMRREKMQSQMIFKHLVAELHKRNQATGEEE